MEVEWLTQDCRDSLWHCWDTKPVFLSWGYTLHRTKKMLPFFSPRCFCLATSQAGRFTKAEIPVIFLLLTHGGTCTSQSCPPHLVSGMVWGGSPSSLQTLPCCSHSCAQSGCGLGTWAWAGSCLWSQCYCSALGLVGLSRGCPCSRPLLSQS